MYRHSLVIACCVLLVAGMASAEVVKWVPAAASNAGALGTYWTTDLWVYTQLQEGTTEIRIAFLPEGPANPNPVEVAIDVPAHTAIRLADVVGTLFGENRPGALRISSDHAFSARSRTYNSGGDTGTFGQGIPAIPDDELQFPQPDGTASHGWVAMGAANRPGELGARTNIGLFNRLDSERDVTFFFLRTADGGVPGKRQDHARPVRLVPDRSVQSDWNW
jgi:hypothetical protein